MAVEAAQTNEIESSAALPPRSNGATYATPPLAESVREMWGSRHLLWLFGAYAIKRTFYRTLLGPGWILLHVALDIGGKTFLFGGVLNVATPNNVPYIIFLLVGMLGWTLFAQTLSFGVKSFQRYRKYADRFHFPLMILPIAASAQALLQFTIQVIVVAGGLTYYALRGHVYFETGPQLLLVPYGLVLCLLFAWGLSFFLAPINYRARDVRLILQYLLQFWLYVTPVVYPLENLHGALLLVAKLNPLAPMVEMIKFGLIGGGNIGLHFLAWGTFWAVGTFVTGFIFMNRYGRSFFAHPFIADDDDDDDVAP